MEIADMLTKLIQNFLNKNIGELEDKNISITLPNGKRIELGNHQSSVEINFNSWLGIWIIFRHGLGHSICVFGFSQQQSQQHIKCPEIMTS